MESAANHCLADGVRAESVGPAGVKATHSRLVALRASDTASDNIHVLQQPGTLRCCNCGLAVTDDMKLPVFDPHDPILARDKHIKKRWDYVRVVLAYDELQTPSFEYSSFVACTPPCALRYAQDHPDFLPSNVPFLLHTMMWERHRIDEPVVPAPSGDCLRYLNQRDGEGLNARSFYQLLANVVLIGYKQSAPMYIPPRGDAEQTALQRRDPTYLQYYFQDLLPSHVCDDLQLPDQLNDGGIQLDANPDSDTETDLATEAIHPPSQPPSSDPPSP